jgi:mono/diheme cytochrome c family protein
MHCSLRRSAVSGSVALAVLAGALSSGPMAWSSPPVSHAAAARTTVSPVERGRAVYRRYGCSFCHGQESASANMSCEGNGRIPPLAYVAEGRTREQVRRTVRSGVRMVGAVDPKAPRPTYRMPPFGQRITERELSDLVAYLFWLSARRTEE